MLNHTIGQKAQRESTTEEYLSQDNFGSQEEIDKLMVEMSESEEMYLITVAQLVEQGIEQPIAISRLAKELTIQPVSANQMVHKLDEEGMVEYLPYKGVQLTEKGRRVARQVLRHRRLWQVFLEEHLQLATVEADALACRLEHITPTEVVNRLAEFLGNPGATSQGLPIPETGAETGYVVLRPLNEVEIGESCEVAQINSDPTTRAFLASTGLQPGQRIRPLGAGSSGDMLLQTGEDRIHLTAELSKLILVK